MVSASIWYAGAIGFFSCGVGMIIVPIYTSCQEVFSNEKPLAEQLARGYTNMVFFIFRQRA
jgi:hypothetical protein